MLLIIKYYILKYNILIVFFLMSSPDEPVVTKRVRTVIEEVVDGKVVSRTEDVDVEVLKK